MKTSTVVLAGVGAVAAGAVGVASLVAANNRRKKQIVAPNPARTTAPQSVAPRPTIVQVSQLVAVARPLTITQIRETDAQRIERQRQAWLNSAEGRAAEVKARQEQREFYTRKGFEAGKAAALTELQKTLRGGGTTVWTPNVQPRAPLDALRIQNAVAFMRGDYRGVKANCVAYHPGVVVNRRETIAAERGTPKEVARNWYVAALAAESFWAGLADRNLKGALVQSEVIFSLIRGTGCEEAFHMQACKAAMQAIKSTGERTIWEAYGTGSLDGLLLRYGLNLYRPLWYGDSRTDWSLVQNRSWWTRFSEDFDAAWKWISIIGEALLGFIELIPGVGNAIAALRKIVQGAIGAVANTIGMVIPAATDALSRVARPLARSTFGGFSKQLRDAAGTTAATMGMVNQAPFNVFTGGA